MTALADAFLNNRADHVPSEKLFSEFIVPPFFQRISIFADKRSVRILGGRGCGKTMFIRYFGHASALNPNRTDLPDTELNAIGLYHRPDTGFCALMSPQWLGPREARLAFSHYVALHLLKDACDAVVSISQARFSEGQLSLNDPRISPYIANQLGLQHDIRVSDLGTQIDDKLGELELWVRNPKRVDAPMFVSYASILPRFASDLAQISPRLSGLAFRVFIDEFENLPELHREVICDSIKHPHERMVIHIAYKKQSVTELKTSSDERIVEIHDLTTIDLENELSRDSGFELLAAELFLLRVHRAGGQFDCPLFDPEKLHDPRTLAHRLSKAYRDQVMRCVREILPTPSSADIARGVLTDLPLRKRLSEMLAKGLELQNLDPRRADELISEEYPQVSIVMGALLNRRQQNGKTLLAQYEQAISKGPTATSPFFKEGGWIHNNLHGCLFHLYAGLPKRANINYAGFDRFCMLSSPNLRFFQALCHATLLLAFQRQSSEELPGTLRVAVDTQAHAAKQVSDKLYEDVQQLGPFGSQLLEVTRRLGKIFEAFNRRRSQSEPEINHFSIDDADRSVLTDSSQRLLREAKIWSVLYEEKDTKNKSDYDIAQTDLVLNPIFAPHFGISYRKRRKITLKAGAVDVLLCQSTAQFELVLKSLVDSGERDPNTMQDLF